MKKKKIIRDLKRRVEILEKKIDNLMFTKTTYDLKEMDKNWFWTVHKDESSQTSGTIV